MQFPLNLHAGAYYDDLWAYKAAEHIAAGDWLGPYSSTTLIKNIGFPLYLAFLLKCHIPYLLGNALLYALAAVVFCVAIRPLIKRKWIFFFFFILLLFCPVSFATDTFARVYRNSITAAQVLFIFAGFLGLYVRLKSGGKDARALKLLPWSVVGALSLSWFWLSREDSIWIVPFCGIAILVMLILLIKQRAFGASVARTAACVVLVALPVGACAIASTSASAVNESYYGVQTKAEINSGNFARFIKDLYAIKPNEMPQNLRVACPHESVMCAYEVSPTLSSIKSFVEDRFYNWGDVYDNNPGDGEVNGGEFFWVFRIAAQDAGVYSNAVSADKFFGKCADEIEAAFANGKLQQRSTMPSSIMTPWRSEYASQLLPSAATIFANAISYADVSTQPFSANGEANIIVDMQDKLQTSAWWQGQDIPLACYIGTGIIWLYRVIGVVLAVAGIISFVALIVAWFRRRKATQTKTWLGPVVLSAAALLLSTFTLICGLTYTEISSFIPISYYYYGSAAYVLLLCFNMLSVSAMVSVICGYEKDDYLESEQSSYTDNSCLYAGKLYSETSNATGVVQ